MKKRKLLFGVSLLVVAGVGFLYYSTRSGATCQALPDSDDATVAAESNAEATAESPSRANASEAPVTGADASPEVRATLRMYAAHAPLRQPPVADPDSVENKRIMQAMIAKALASKETAYSNK